ncbi:MAG: hypothetical protein V1807_00755 [Patescibacteria group bacterium]
MSRNRRPEPQKYHPWLIIEKKGSSRVTIGLLKDVADAVSRPFVDAFLTELRQYLKRNRAIEDAEEIILVHFLNVQGMSISAHYLEVGFNICGAPGTGLSKAGPVATIDLLQRKICWHRLTQTDNHIYQEMVAHPDLFRDTLEKALHEMFGFVF